MSEVQTSKIPLRLRSYEFHEFSFQCFQDDGGKRSTTISLQGKLASSKTDPNIFKVHLKCSITGENLDCPLLIIAELAGVFETTPEVPEAERDITAYLNGSGVLYGILRAHVDQMSALFPCGRFTMPTVLMSEMLCEPEGTENAPDGPTAEQHNANEEAADGTKNG